MLLPKVRSEGSLREGLSEGVLWTFGASLREWRRVRSHKNRPHPERLPKKSTPSALCHPRIPEVFAFCASRCPLAGCRGSIGNPITMRIRVLDIRLKPARPNGAAGRAQSGRRVKSEADGVTSDSGKWCCLTCTTSTTNRCCSTSKFSSPRSPLCSLEKVRIRMEK